MRYLIAFFLLFTTVAISQISPTEWQFIDSLLSVNNKIKDKKQIAKNYLRVSRIYGWNDLKKSEEYGLLALQLSVNSADSELIAISKRELASVYGFQGNTKKSLEYAIGAVKAAELIKDKTLMASAENTLGYLYTMAKKYAEAEEHLLNAIKLNREAGNDNLSAASSLNNLANVYMLIGKYEESIVYRNKALVIRIKLKNKNAVSDTYNDMGETFALMKNLDSAIYYLELSHKIKRETDDKEMLSLTAQNLARLYIEKNNLSEADKYVKVAYENALAIGSDSYRKQCYEILSDLYERKGNTLLSLSYLRKFIALKDSISSDQLQKEIAQLNEEFQSEKKALTIKNLESQISIERQLADERDKRKLIIIWTSVLGFIVVAYFLFILNKRLKEIRLQKKKIEEQKQEVELKQKEILDSIHYAKRIQQSLLTPEKYIERKIKNLKK